MGQDNSVDRFRLKGHARGEIVVVMVLALMHAAVEQYAAEGGSFQQVARTSDLLRGTEESEIGYLERP